MLETCTVYGESLSLHDIKLYNKFQVNLEGCEKDR